MKYCVLHCVGIQDFIEILKAVYVQESKRHLKETQSKLNVTRVSAMSGIRRREVERLYDKPVPTKQHRGFMSRVVTRWTSNSKYMSSNDSPRSLSCDGPGSEFYLLCQEETTEVTPRSILSHLISTGIVNVEDGIATLQTEGYTPIENPKEAFEFVGMDIGDLIETAVENVLKMKEPKSLHLTTEYEDLLIQAEPEIREWILREGGNFHRRVRSYLSQYDVSLQRGKDPNKSENETDEANEEKEMLRVVFSTFSRTHKAKIKKD